MIECHVFSTKRASMVATFATNFNFGWKNGLICAFCKLLDTDDLR